MTDTPSPTEEKGRSKRRIALTVSFICLWVAAAVYLAVAHGPEIVDAFKRMPWPVLLGAVLAQIAVVILRIEAWRLCLESAGARLKRSTLYGAGSAAAPLSLVNLQLSAAARIGVLRKLEPKRAPSIATLCAAEIPVYGAEVILGAALLLFVGPALGLPWFVAPAGLALGAGVLAWAARTTTHSSRRFAEGLHILVDKRRAAKLGAAVSANTFFQVARIWLLLVAAGIEVSPVDATAVLIGQGLLSQLPIGSAGAASASVMVIGNTAAAGAGGALAAVGLALTATELTAAFCLLFWSLTIFIPWLLSGRRQRRALAAQAA